MSCLSTSNLISQRAPAYSVKTDLTMTFFEQLQTELRFTGY